MEDVYGLHLHTHCVVMYIGKEIATYIFFTSDRNFDFSYVNEVQLGAFIAYDKERSSVTGFGWGCKDSSEQDVIGDFRDGLYNLFKKDKETWDEEDKFLMKAVSDYLPLAVKNTMEEMKLEIESFDLFHYAIVVPSEWEEEIRDDIIRPIFVQSGLISNQDRRDRLLFFTDIESLCYNYSFKRGQNTILCRISPETYKTNAPPRKNKIFPEEKTLIKFDLIQTTTTLFNFPNAQLFPKVIKSRSVSVTIGNIDNRIKDFLRENLFLDATKDDDGPENFLYQSCTSQLTPSGQDQIINAIMEGINSRHFPSLEEDEHPKEAPWITLKEEWMLSERQKKFINSLCPSIICAKIGTFLLAYMNDIISNNFTKSYEFLVAVDENSYMDFRVLDDIKWLKYILEYNRRSLSSIVAITGVYKENNILRIRYILKGVGIGVFETIQNSDIHCKPRIISSVDLTPSSSIFLHSKPDAIINLDISLGSTLITCSILDEDGLIQQIFNNDSFIGNNLPPLGYFYSFSNTMTLHVKEKFIPFAERYLLGDLSDFTGDEYVSTRTNLLFEMKSILTNDLSNGEAVILTDKQKYINAFILMYMIYIKEEILYRLPDQLISDQMDMKIGYAVSIEAMLLNKTLESRNNLKDIIYESGLVPKDDHSKKLRITTQGERILPAIQRSLKLELPLKSYFLLCQLHEDYVQLSLHQVVTASSPEEKEQESIIVQDEILLIQNIYDSLCCNMWYSLLQDSSLVKSCEIHNTSDNSKLFELFSSETKTAFFANLKHHFSDNMLQDNSDMQSTNTINLTSSCNCKVCLTTSDIIDISFTPVLQGIACSLYASLLNKELFGNYINIDYLFSFIRFNNSPKLQYAFARILEEEADDFNLELGIDTSCLVVPKLFNELLKPVIRQELLCYKDFKIGALRQVCNENYLASITRNRDEYACPLYKSNLTDTEKVAFDDDIAFPFLNKGDIIHNAQLNRKFYMSEKFNKPFIAVRLFKTVNHLWDNEELSPDDSNCQHVFETYLQRRLRSKGRTMNVPVIISVRYVSYASSLKFSASMAGEEIVNVVETREPLTLTRL